MNDQVESIVTFVVYLLAMLGIGLYFYSSTEDLSEYVLGYRKLGVWGTYL